MPPNRIRRRKAHGLYFHSSAPRVLQMNSNQMQSKIRDDKTKEVLVIKPSNIRIWIHDKDIGKLTKVIWEGQGMRLRTETSSNPKVRRFLESMPHVMGVIKDVHSACIDNDLDTLMVKTADPTPPILLSSKDANGLTPLHKAAGLAHTQLVEYLLKMWPSAAAEPDHGGRTPLHWAASAKNNDRCFNLLVIAGADETSVDNRNKSAGYYKQNPKEIDRALLTVVPDAPRIAPQNIIQNFDWNMLTDIESKNSNNNNPPRKVHTLLSPNQLNQNSSKLNSHTMGKTYTSNENLLANGTHAVDTLAPNHISNFNSRKLNSDEIEDEAVQAAINPSHRSGSFRRTTPRSLDKPEDGNPPADLNNNHNPSSAKANGHNVEMEVITNGGGGDDDMDDDGNNHHQTNSNNNSINYNNVEDNSPNDIDNDKPDEEENETVNDAKTDEEIEDKKQESDDEEKSPDEPEPEEEPELNDHETSNELIPDEPDNKDNGKENDEENSVKNDEENEEEEENHSETVENATPDLSKENDENNNEEDAKELDTGGDSHPATPLNEANDEEQNDSETEENKDNEENEENEDNANDDNEIKENVDILVIDRNNKDEDDGKDEPEEDEDENQADENNGSEEDTDKTAEKRTESPSSSLEIKGRVEGEPDTGHLQSRGGDHTDDDYKEKSIVNIIDSGNMEKLAEIVLNGSGNKLLGLTSYQPEIQAFLDNVPAYMNKIRRVHVAAREGSLRNLQSALDRRKFSTAKDEISPHGGTPLHVATIFGHTGIVRYLAGRFPETITTADEDGRTALHYAATIQDNGHFYNLLMHLGANPNTEDNFGKSAEFYTNHEVSQSLLSHKQLLRDYGSEEDLAEEMLNDQDKQKPIEIPLFGSDEGRYLATSLGDPLIKGLTEVANKRPEDPISFLATYLQNFAMQNNKSGTKANTSSAKTDDTVRIVQPATHTNHTRAVRKEESISDDSPHSMDSPETAANSEDRDEHGQSMLHFACARSHGRNALIQLIEDSGTSITHRDELYRTARDVSLQATQPDNAKEIDRFVLSLAAKGDYEAFSQMVIEGYDHIIDVVDSDGTTIADVTRNRGYQELAKYLDSIHHFEEKRENLLSAVRSGDMNKVKEYCESSDGLKLVRAKNYYGRNALHIAVLMESEELVEYLSTNYKNILRIGDNLERTPLHYAMGVSSVEALSRILIKNGAKRVLKDLKGRQPSYYFMNKADILRLQEEEKE